MARPRATEEQREAQRQRIRTAAKGLYEESGIERVSIRGVASRAGVSQGTIYSYFADRNELLRSLWLEPVNEVSQELETLVDTTKDPVERIRALLLAYMEFAITHPDIHRGALLFVRPSSSAKPETEPPAALAFYRLLLGAITELDTSRGLPLDDPGLAVELLWASVHGALGLAINTDVYELSPAATLAPRMVDLLMNSVVAPPEV